MMNVCFCGTIFKRSLLFNTKIDLFYRDKFETLEHPITTNKEKYEVSHYEQYTIRGGVVTIIVLSLYVGMVASTIWNFAFNNSILQQTLTSDHILDDFSGDWALSLTAYGTP